MLIRLTGLVLAGAAWLAAAEFNPPSLDKLQPRDFQRMWQPSLSPAPILTSAQVAPDRVVCSIPLMEIKVRNPEAIQRKTFPAAGPKMSFDHMAGPNPAAACRDWNK